MLNEPHRTPTPWQTVMALQQYVQQLQCQLNDQQAAMNRMCQQLEALQARMDAADNKPFYHVDTIQYHFDQLKVEKLDGTLNIGMTAPNEEQIKEIGQLVMPGGGGKSVVNDPKVSMQSGNDSQATDKPHQFPSPASTGFPSAVVPEAPYPEIRQRIDCYLDQTAPLRLQQLEAETGIALDPFHRRMIIEDIRKQMSARIQFYIQSAARDGEGGKNKGTAVSASLKEDVISKTERDIETALQNYLSRLLHKE